MKAKPPCSVDGCTRPFYARDMCRPHYARFMRTGDLDLSPRGVPWTIAQDGLLLALLHQRAPSRRFGNGVLVDTAEGMGRTTASVAQRMQVLAKRYRIVRPQAVTE